MSLSAIKFQRRPLNRRGMELSINFLVTLILAITIFGFGIYLVRQFFGFAEEAQQKIDIQTQEEIERRLLDAGEKAAIPLNKARVKRAQVHTFGLGILNSYKTSRTFSVSVKFTKAFDESNNELIEAEQDYMNKNWLFSSVPDVQLDANEHAFTPLTVRVDSKMTSPEGAGSSGSATLPGTYVFNVCVQPDGVPLVDCADVDLNELPNLHGGQVLKLYVQVV